MLLCAGQLSQPLNGFSSFTIAPRLDSKGETFGAECFRLTVVTLVKCRLAEVKRIMRHGHFVPQLPHQRKALREVAPVRWRVNPWSNYLFSPPSLWFLFFSPPGAPAGVVVLPGVSGCLTGVVEAIVGHSSPLLH